LRAIGLPMIPSPIKPTFIVLVLPLFFPDGFEGWWPSSAGAWVLMQQSPDDCQQNYDFSGDWVIRPDACTEEKSQGKRNGFELHDSGDRK
jgi:hypothetical protein